MSLHVERIGDVAVVVPKGMLRGGKETDELQNVLRKLTYDQQKKILLDLGETTHMTSIAIGVLAGVHASAASKNLYFWVCNIEKRIESILVQVKLLNMLTVFPTREEALAAFAKL
jgi:anti-anti-sigma factor